MKKNKNKKLQDEVLFPKVSSQFISVKNKIEELNKSVDIRTENLLYLSHFGNQNNQNIEILNFRLKKNNDLENKKLNKSKDNREKYKISHNKDSVYKNFKLKQSEFIYNNLKEYFLENDNMKEILLINYILENKVTDDYLSDLLDVDKIPIQLKYKKIKEIDKFYLNRELEIKREIAFGINDMYRIRPKSNIGNKNRADLKLHLMVGQAVEIHFTVKTKRNNSQNNLKIKNSNLDKNFKATSHSWDFDNEENNINKFHERRYIKNEKSKREEIIKKIKIEEKMKILELKKKIVKDKYNQCKGVQRDNDKMFKIFRKVSSNFNVNKSVINNSSNISNYLNKNNNNSTISFISPNIENKTFMSTFLKSSSMTNLQNLNNKIPQTDLKIKKFNNIFNPNKSQNSFLNCSQAQADSTRTMTRTARKLNSSLNNFNETHFRSSFSSSFNPSSFNSTQINFNKTKKINIEQSILKSCEKTKNNSMDLTTNLKNYQNNLNIKIKSNKNISNNFLVNVDYLIQDKDHKIEKKFFIYPNGSKNPAQFISEDKNHVLFQSKKIDKIKEETAYGIRNIIYNKFDTRLFESELHNYKQDVKKDSSKLSHIDEYQKEIAKNNFFRTKKYLTNIEYKNAKIRKKVDVLMEKYKNEE